MQVPIRVDPSSTQTLQGQLFDQFRTLILNGLLKPGTTVPATRALAEQLSLSRNTVALAYERLITEGYLETRRAVGTFVSSDIPEDTLGLSGARDADPAAPADGIENHRPPLRTWRRHGIVNPHRNRLAVDFWVGRPDPRSFPVRAWRRLMINRMNQAGSALTEYGHPAGLFELREALAKHLAVARGIKARPEQIIIVAGCQESLNIVARLLLEPGGLAAVECPGYQGAAYLFDSYGATVRPVRVDEHGLDTDDLPREATRIVYVTPSHQYPLGHTMPLERRLRLLEWAAGAGAYIVEDDYDSDFRYSGSPLSALTGLDRHGCVIYLGTFSKSVGAGIRMGYMVVPEHLIEAATTAKALLNNGHPWLDQAVLADFIASGSYANHLRKIRHLYKDRRDALLEALETRFGAIEVTGEEGGMHIAWHIPGDLPTASEMEAVGLSAGVGVYSLENGAACAFEIERYKNVLLLGYSSVTETEIRTGINRLANALAESRKAP